MRILFTDLARQATVTSLYETESYPAANLVDVFLDTLFVSVLPYDTVTIDLGSNRTVDSIFLAGCNAAFVDFELVNQSSSVVYTATKNIQREVDTLYFPAVVCRYINFTVDITDGYAIWYKTGDDVVVQTSGQDKWVDYDPLVQGYVKIKGCGAGVSKSYPNITQKIGFGAANETPFSRSKTGQVLRNATPTFKTFRVEIPSLNHADFKSLAKSLETFGIHYPTYFDFTEDSVDFCDPVYAEIPEVFTYERRDSDLYIVTIPLLEAR